MRSTKAGAIYFDEHSPVKRSPRNRFMLFVPAFLAALLFMLLAAQAMAITTNVDEPNRASAAGFGLCEFGQGMTDRGGWDTTFGNYAAEKSPNRWITGKEAFGENVWFVKYYGEGADGGFFMAKPDKDRATDYVSPAHKTKLQDFRKFSVCLGTINTYVANGAMGFSSTVANLASYFATNAFKTNLVCAKPTDTGGCFQLLKVIGGTKTSGVSDQGIIGVLTTSIYLPLIVLVVVATGVWIAYTGFVKRQLREALWGAIWLVVASVLGLTFLFRPAMLVAAPMKVSNAVAGCVISAFSGADCWSGTGGSSGSSRSLSSDDVCRAEGGGPADAMEIVATGLSCSIWKAFVLEPYAQGSFGQSFASLDTSPNSSGGTTLKKAIKKSKYKDDSNLFCVSLRVQGRLDHMVDGNLKLANPSSGGRICNIALYQLMLKTNAEHSGNPGSPGSSGTPIMEDGVDKRWYSIIDVVASDDNLWGAWTGSGSKLSSAMMAALASVLGGAIIIVIALFAMVYYISSVLLMAFAPLFFLLGVHPGRGRDILKGYGEMVISNVFKYVASALFLIVTLALYGGVLGNSTSLGASLLFVIILSVALFMYRKEVIELLGKVNMGGEKMSSRLADAFGRKAGQVAQTGGIMAGAAIGSGAAAMSVRDVMGGSSDAVRSMVKGDFKQAGKSLGRAVDGLGVKGAASGASEAAGRELRKPGGLLGPVGAAAARGYDSHTSLNERMLAIREQEAQNARKSLEDEMNDPESVYNIKENLRTYEQKTDDLSAVKGELDGLAEAVRNFSHDDLLREMESMPGGVEWGQAVALSQEISNLEGRITIARENGGDTRALQVERDGALAAWNQVHNNLQEAGLWDTLESHYTSAINEHNQNVQSYDEKVEVFLTIKEEAETAHKNAVLDYNKQREDVMEKERLKAQEDFWREKNLNLAPGDRLSDRQQRKLQEEADKHAEERANAAGAAFDAQYADRLRLKEIMQASPPSVDPAPIAAPPAPPTAPQPAPVETPRPAPPAAPSGSGSGGSLPLPPPISNEGGLDLAREIAQSYKTNAPAPPQRSSGIPTSQEQREGQDSTGAQARRAKEPPSKVERTERPSGGGLPRAPKSRPDRNE